MADSFIKIRIDLQFLIALRLWILADHQPEALTEGEWHEGQSLLREGALSKITSFVKVNRALFDRKPFVRFIKEEMPQLSLNKKSDFIRFISTLDNAKIDKSGDWKQLLENGIVNQEAKRRRAAFRLVS